MTAFSPPKLSIAVGRSKSQVVPHSTVFAPAQVIVGGVESITVTVWLQVAALPQMSIAVQVRVAVKVFPQAELVSVRPGAIMTFAPSHASRATGVSKVQLLPHSTVLSEPQRRSGGVASTTVTVWLHRALLLQLSVASHVRVAVSV